jgi:hypothetical protein
MRSRRGLAPGLRYSLTMSLLGAHRSVRAGAAACALLSAFVLLANAPVARAARPLTTALTDSVWFDGGPSWFQKTIATRARVALLEVDWLSVEPSAPAPGVNPTDPSGPQFRFAYLDAVVRQLAANGIAPAFLVSDAPAWAEAAGGPTLFETAGAWKPNAVAYGQLAAALAERYSGSYPDPLNAGVALPRVRYFQAWAEANFSVHLAPQWTRSGNHWTPTGPVLYRSLLNAFYAGVKGVHSDDVVITTGFGPYGDPPGSCGNREVGNGCRMRPAMFARELMCLKGAALQPEACPTPAHFDALAMDPYQVASPTTPAFNADDISSADLGKLTRIVAKAVGVGRALPRAHKQLWVTEFSYDSNPPNPTGVSLATQARWLEEAFYVFWKQGVSTVVWYLLRDQTARYEPNGYYSGVFYYNGVAKPAFEAFRFPFVVWPIKRRATVWGISPQSGRLLIQRRGRSSWKTLFTLRVSSGSVFTRTIPATLRGSFRAVVAGESSLAWSR